MKEDSALGIASRVGGLFCAQEVSEVQFRLSENKFIYSRGIYRFEKSSVWHSRHSDFIKLN